MLAVASLKGNERMQLQFTKMHGLGNDFVVLDGVSQSLPAVDTHMVRLLSDRKRGVGCDQVLLLEPPTDQNADFLYRIFNADGEEVEQCGNGARCVAQFAQHKLLPAKNSFVVQTTGASLQLRVLDDDRVGVCMPPPDFTPAAIPLLSESEGPMHTALLAGGVKLSFAALTVGNPHAVFFVAEVKTAQVETIGPALQQSGCFPKGVNVGFCQIVNTGFMRLRVYERGVGETQACGSGACAAVAAGQQLGKLQQTVKVALSGGELDIRWSGMGEWIQMTGRATIAFEGCIEL